MADNRDEQDTLTEMDRLSMEIAGVKMRDRPAPDVETTEHDREEYEKQQAEAQAEAQAKAQEEAERLAPVREAVRDLAERYRSLAREYEEKADTLEDLADSCSPRLLDVLAETQIDVTSNRWYKPTVMPMLMRIARAFDVLTGKSR